MLNFKTSQDWSEINKVSLSIYRSTTVTVGGIGFVLQNRFIVSQIGNEWIGFTKPIYHSPGMGGSAFVFIKSFFFRVIMIFSYCNFLKRLNMMFKYCLWVLKRPIEILREALIFRQTDWGTSIFRQTEFELFPRVVNYEWPLANIFSRGNFC